MFKTLSRLLLLLLLLPAASCAGKKKKYNPYSAKLSKYVDVPVQKLFNRAEKKMNRARHVWPFKKELHRTSVPREMFLEVTRRPDAGALREKAEIRIADSYRLEGSDLSYAEAIARYKTFIQFHPNHAQGEEVQWSLSQCYYLQRSKPGRDQNMGRNAETELKMYLQRYPQGENAARAHEQIALLVDARAHHELSVGDYYLVRRAPVATEGRYKLGQEIQPLLDGTPEMEFHLGELACGKGEFTAAKSHYENCLKAPPTAKGKMDPWAKKAQRAIKSLPRREKRYHKYKARQEKKAAKKAAREAEMKAADEAAAAKKPAV